MNLTYRFRVKSKSGQLRRWARAVNFVWNYCNESQRSCLRLGKKWLSGFDLTYLTSGTSKELGLPAETIRSVCMIYAQSRMEKKRPYLRWRSRRSLGWVPFKSRNIKINGDVVRFFGMDFRVFDSRPLPAGSVICDGGSFSEDSLGRWYINIVIRVPTPAKRPIEASVGLDLGLKSLATLSNGEKIENPRVLGRFVDKLGRTQRASKKRLARKVAQRIANIRRDFQHKLSRNIVERFDFIAVGNASPSKLAKTRMAKSVLDAGWSSFRQMLAYKAIAHGATYAEVNENHSTQVCSRCGCLPDGRPEGIADLGIREWTCGECGAFHDRDVNAALNILRSGHGSLAEGAVAV